MILVILKKCHYGIKRTLNGNYRVMYKFVISDYTSFNNQIINFILLKMIILVISLFICHSRFSQI